MGRVGGLFQRNIFLPKARHKWQHLLFKEFNFVNEYNYEVCRIWRHFKFYNEDLTKDDLLENTYSTSMTNIVI